VLAEFIENSERNPAIDAALAESAKIAAEKREREQAADLEPKGSKKEAAPAGADEAAIRMRAQNAAKAEADRLKAVFDGLADELKGLRKERRAANEELDRFDKLDRRASLEEIRTWKGLEARLKELGGRIAALSWKADSAQMAYKNAKNFHKILRDANKGGDSDSGKQACELKALKAIVAKLSGMFPGRRIVLLLDSLYSCEKAIKLIEEAGMDYVCRTKAGRLPCVAKALKAARDGSEPQPGAAKKIIRKNHMDATLIGISKFDYKGSLFSVAYLKEAHRFSQMFISSLEIDGLKGAESLISAGRRRWNIENSVFNSQKRHGYNLEHPFCKSREGQKCHFILIQIAHAISQLFEMFSPEIAFKGMTIKKYHKLLQNRIAALGTARLAA
jgi:hypothetical protein